MNFSLTRFCRLFLLTYALVFGSVSSHSASISESKDDLNECNQYSKEYNIYGNIAVGDASKLKKTISDSFDRFRLRCKGDYSFPKVLIDSSGGNVDEAMDIGTFIKRLGLNVEAKGKCFSACVFILAGGNSRFTVFAKVGIHRPYFKELDASSDVSQVSQKRQQLLNKIRTYFVAMDVNPSLADDMLSTPPDRITILSESELEKYRLNIQDANYEEQYNAIQAKHYGITSSEYRRRNSAADQQCGKTYKRDYDCVRLILWDLTDQEFRRRENIYNVKCKSVNDKFNKNDLTTTQAILSCTGDVMRTGR
ncbi:MAG: hypothetical protein K9K38_05535 [Rhodoferax sp.]|nr:hypothetical protein [Rhodoferax sp.]MCF8208853.1 hypothetical protein [Rhodoferax sp.]